MWALRVNEWSDVKWSDVEWTDAIYVKLFCFEVRWVMLKFLGTKVPCTLGWPYIESTRLYYDYFIWRVSCTVFVLTCFVTCGCVCMCGYFDKCVDVLIICVLVFTAFCIFCTVFLYCFVYVYLLLLVLSVLVQGLPPPSEISIAVSK
jgi:hypothetical protein